MSKTTVSASATGLPSRRLFLATGPAAAVFMSLRKAAAEESPLTTLIERGKALSAAYDDLCERPEFDLSDRDPRKASLNAELSRLQDEEWDALAEICAYPVRSMEEARIKAAYVAEHSEFFVLEEHLVTALLRSFLV